MFYPALAIGSGGLYDEMLVSWWLDLVLDRIVALDLMGFETKVAGVYF